MVPTPSAQILLVVAVGAAACSAIEMVFDGDILACAVAHALGALLALLLAYSQIRYGPFDISSLIFYVMQRSTLVFVFISVVTATIIEGGLSPNPLRRFVAHYFGLLFAVRFTGWW
jgi:uncharacterized membrane protein YjjP (DUF1212 family)